MEKPLFGAAKILEVSAPHQFGGFLQNLHPGDTVEFTGTLAGDIGDRTPTVDLHSIVKQ